MPPAPVPHYLKSKQHYHLLDGLRGIAAVSVVVFHFCEWINTDFKENFIGHGFLAVDFFFCLSGFVMGYAYDNRVKKMGIITFLKTRFIRLHPMVVLGTILGLLGLLLDPFVNTIAYSPTKLFVIFMASNLMIPLPIMPDRFFNNFGLNAPSWSLFWEYMVNIGYVLVFCKLRNNRLLFVTILSAILLGYVSQRDGNLSGGWAASNFWVGGVRVLFSFSAGLLIYRQGLIIKNKVGFIPLSILLIGAFVFPFFPKNWLFESVIVILYFPLLVSLGAGSTISEKIRPICEFAGNISYPLYMSHYAFIWIFSGYLLSVKPQTNELIAIVTIGTMLLILWAWFVMVKFEIPLRNYLRKKLL